MIQYTIYTHFQFMATQQTRDPFFFFISTHQFSWENHCIRNIHPFLLQMSKIRPHTTWHYVKPYINHIKILWFHRACEMR